MSDYKSLEDVLMSTLDLSRRPVAIAFRDTPPKGVTQFMGVQPSGCSFWTLASDGRVFYTLAADHYNCPIGSYTHNIPLPPEREHELSQTLSLMAEIGYIRMEEVPGIPRVSKPTSVIVYAPLAASFVEPDAVILSGSPHSVMLLHEAAARANLPVQPLYGRPTCMAIPASMSRGIAISFGCVGNRVYTGLPSGELYSVIAGKDLQTIVDHLSTVASANATLRNYHEARVATLRS